MHTILATSSDPLGFLTEFGVEWRLLVSQALSFGIVAAALYYFVFRPVSAVASKRREEIQKGLDDAKAAAEALANAQADANKKLQQAIQESAKILKDARNDAKAALERAVSDAEAKAAEIRQRNAEQLESDKALMKEQLRGELSQLVVETARKAVGEILTDEQRKLLAENAAKKLEI